MNRWTEVNFDGLVGPTHNHAGLSHGNVASANSAARRSRPRAAALQGLAKMRAVADLGIPQAFLPPQMRPDFGFLRSVGFDRGGDAEVLARVATQAPRLLAAACSSSFMWTANAATVVPSADSADGRLHLVPANLLSQPHRSAETRSTCRALRCIFSEEDAFKVHEPLPASLTWSDEGAANHTRFHGGGAGPGVHLFVYGCEAGNRSAPRPSHFPARQTLEASEAVARLAQLDPETVVFAHQDPDAIDAGVFHNDVIATGHGSVHLVHERAFLAASDVRARLEFVFRKRTGAALKWIEVPEDEVPLEEAVRTYLFNSQLVTLPSGGVHLIAPKECEESAHVAGYLRRLTASSGSAIRSVSYFDLRESMANGGGPACLRLRVPMTEKERALVHPGVWLTPERHAELEAWVKRWYRDELVPADLADPSLAREAREALRELSDMIGLHDLYP